MLTQPVGARVKAFAVVLAAFLICLLPPFAGASRLLWIAAAACLPIVVIQLVELVRGASLQVLHDGVRTVDALGREKFFEFSECSAFDVWTVHQRRRQVVEMVVFNYTGDEKAGFLSKQNKNYSGYNAHIKGTFGLTADALANLLNVNRAALLESRHL